jgi:hypothetical protein
MNMNMNMKMKMDTDADMDTNMNVEHGHWNFSGFVIVSLQNHNTAPAQYRKCTVGYSLVLYNSSTLNSDTVGWSNKIELDFPGNVTTVALLYITYF